MWKHIKTFAPIVGLLAASLSLAQNSTFQSFQPQRWNTYKRVNGCIKPAAPSVLGATTISSTRIDLGWTDNATNESKFNLERCSGVSCSSFSEINEPAANATSYSNTSLTQGTSYSYRIDAENTCGTSSYSNTATAVTWWAESCAGAQVCFKFDEASGDIADTAAGITYTATGASTYSVAGTGLFSEVSTAIFTDQSGRSFDHADHASWTFTGNAMTLEYYVSSTDTASTGDKYFFTNYDGAGTKGMEVWWKPSNSNFGFYAEAPDGTFAFINTTCSWNDGNIHKIRQSVDFTSTINTFVDGVSCGTGDVSALNGKTINGGAISILNQGSGGTKPVDANVYLMRISGSLSNIGGPGGG